MRLGRASLPLSLEEGTVGPCRHRAVTAGRVSLGLAEGDAVTGKFFSFRLR